MSTVTETGEEDAQQADGSKSDIIIVNNQSQETHEGGDDAENGSTVTPNTESQPEDERRGSEPESDEEFEDGVPESEEVEISDTEELEESNSPTPEAEAEAQAEPHSAEQSEAESTVETTAPQPGATQPGTEPKKSNQTGAVQTTDSDSPNPDPSGGDAEPADGEGEDVQVESDSTESEETDILSLQDEPATFSLEAEASHLKQITSVVNTLVDEFRLRMTDDEMRIRAVDAANIGMVDIQIDGDLFESYTATPGALGINLSAFQDALSLADSDDYVAMTLNPETRKLEMDIGNLDYTMGLISPASIRQDPDLPALELPADVLLEGSTLDRGVKAADMVSDRITISTVDNSNDIRLHTEGDTDEVSELIPERDLVDADTPQQEVSSIFALEYLRSINRALPNSNTVQMRLGDEFPIELSFDDKGGDIEVKFMLAPRVES